jgi:hypothetical protein
MTGKRKLGVVPPQETPVAQVLIQAFASKPPTVKSSATLADTLRLLAVAISTLANSMEPQPQAASADQADKPRQYLGPRT